MRKPRVPRSGKWPAVSKRFLKGKKCAVCGGKEKLVAHHIVPFHIDPTKELDESNLMPVCEGRGSLNCHYWCGHLGDWRSWNEDARSDAEYFLQKITERP